MGTGMLRACDLPGCDDPHNARGLCSRHYHRWKRRKGLPPGSPPGPPPELVMGLPLTDKNVAEIARRVWVKVGGR